MAEKDYREDEIITDGACMFSAFDHNDGEIHLYAVLDRGDRDAVLAQLRVAACEGPQEFFVAITQMKLEERIMELELPATFIF